MRTRNAFLGLVVFFAIGCVGQPDTDSTRSDLTADGWDPTPTVDLSLLVSRPDWQRADACGERLPPGRLARVEGDPGLGAWVDYSGHVVCVDTMSRLRAEIIAGPIQREPDPQPM